MQQADCDKADRFIHIVPAPANRAAVNGVDELVVLLFDGAVLVANLAEDFGHSRDADTHLGLQWQHLEGEIAGACQRAKIAQRICESCPSGAQGQAATAAWPVHFLQRQVQSGEIGKVEFSIEVIWRQVVNQMGQVSQIEDALATFSRTEFSEDELNQIDSILAK